MDTNLDTPLEIVKPAIVMKQFSFTIIPSENKVRATMKFYDASGNLVKEQECEFTDPAVTNAVIPSGKVGKKYIDVLMAAIQNKCKTQLGLAGTDTPV